MARNILILGASYGSLLATKLLMAGHNVTLVCRKKTAELINRDGTERSHQAARGADAPGDLFARSAWHPGRDNARGRRPYPLRSGWSRHAGTPIHQPYNPGSDDQNRRGEVALPFDHEHAAPALSQTDSGAVRNGTGGGLYECSSMGTVQAGTGVTLLA